MLVDGNRLRVSAWVDSKGLKILAANAPLIEEEDDEEEASV